MALAVVDASVAVKWFLDEEYSAAALRLRSDFLEGTLHLRLPAVLPWEVMNALLDSGDFSPRELARAAEGLDRAGLLTVPLFGEYLKRTLEIALSSEITICDASYLALAAIEECPVYTADEEMLNVANERIQVLHVRDYVSPAAL